MIKLAATALQMYQNFRNGAPLRKRTEPIDEAKQQRLGKTAKVATAHEAVLTNSVAQLDKDERAAVNTYRNDVMKARGFTPPHDAVASATGEDGMMVADDVTVTNITKNGAGLLASALTMGLVGVGLWAAKTYLFDDETEQPKDPPAVEQRTGNLKLRKLSDFPNWKGAD